jgi:hypothetical protein
MSVEAAARNEELFRTVNEQIEAVSQTVPATESNMEFLCECDDVECVEKVSLTRAEYEAVRAVPTHFIVLPDHAGPEVEHVVSSNERFAVVEKRGAAASDAEVNDPRTTSRSIRAASASPLPATLPASATLRESAMQPYGQHPRCGDRTYGKDEITGYRFTLAG